MWRFIKLCMVQRNVSFLSHDTGTQGHLVWLIDSRCRKKSSFSYITCNLKEATTRNRDGPLFTQLVEGGMLKIPARICLSVAFNLDCSVKKQGGRSLVFMICLWVSWSHLTWLQKQNHGLYEDVF